MAKKLLWPEDVKDWLVRRYNNQHRIWFDGGGVWPLRISLGIPLESEVATDVAGIRAWVDSWSGWAGPGSLEFVERKWARLGSQTLPSAVVLTTPQEAAAWCGEEQRWLRARGRYREMCGKWQVLLGVGGVGRFFEVLADYSDPDFERLLSVLRWFLENPHSKLYVRQLPVVGVDTKWLQRRTGVVCELLSLIRRVDQAGDFFAVTGLRRQPHRLRMRVLCPRLRASVGGLTDIEAPAEEIASLPLSPESLLVVENHESGIALPDIPGVVAFIGLGKAVTVLAALPWVKKVPAVYWGDIDTHGLAILSTARATLPGLRSILMDQQTLEAFKELAVMEPMQVAADDLPQLTDEERALFHGLRAGTWGTKLRLEQERLPWSVVSNVLRRALGPEGERHS